MTAILLTLLASLLGSTAQTTIGFGIALFLSPVMFLLLEPVEAVLATLTAATAVSVLMLLGERDRLALDRGVSAGLLLPMVPGVLLGTGLLAIVDKAYLQIAVGLVVLCTAPAWQSVQATAASATWLAWLPVAGIAS